MQPSLEGHRRRRRVALGRVERRMPHSLNALAAFPVPYGHHPGNSRAIEQSLRLSPRPR
jgi:hypothetical protein